MSDSNNSDAAADDSASGLSGAAFEERIYKILDEITAQNIEKALDLTQTLAKEHPERAEPYHLIGLAAIIVGDSGRAIELFQEAHRLDPDRKEYAEALSITCTKVGKLTEGLYFAKLAMTLEHHPDIDFLLPQGMRDYFEALSDVQPPRHIVGAMTMFNTRLFEKAAELCGMALRLDNRNTAAHLILAKSLMEMHEPDRAMAALHTVIYLDPAHTEARILLADCLDRLGRRQEADEAREAAAALDPDSAPAAAAAVRAAVFRPDVTPARIAAAETRTAERLERAAAGQNPPPVSSPSVQNQDLPGGGERLRIGYIGAGFYDSPDAAFFRNVIGAHNKANAEVFVYQESVNQSELVVQLQGLTGNWREIYELSPDVVASIISGDDIDMLIDLGGYSLEMPLTAMAMKPAKKQAGWMKHIDGAGSRTIDLVFSDSMTKDLDDANLCEGQSPVFIEGGLFALNPPGVFNPAGESPGRETGRVTFAAAADLERLNPKVIRVWSEILRAVPGSRLMLRDMVSETGFVAGCIAEMFSHFGVIDQVKFFRSDTDVRIDPLFFEEADICLDPFPVSQPEDAALSLWAGAPVVTMKGPTRMGRFGACVLNSAGRNEWIADGEDAYIETAVKLTEDLDRLAEIRAGLRESVRETPLFKPEFLARSLETAANLVLRGDSASG